MLCAKDFGIVRGQTLQVVEENILTVKSCFNVQKTDFGGRSTVFRHYFIINGFGKWIIRKDYSEITQ